jgi:hypothetical protein
MKKLTAFTLCTVLALVLMSASVAPFAAQAAAPTFLVRPSHDKSGATDFSNIMAAFAHAVAAGPGSTVQFAAGDFYVDKPIAVANFSGTVRGRGKNLTRLHTAPNKLFPLSQYPDLPACTFMSLYLDSAWPAAKTADVTVSDLAFHIDGACEPWGFSGNPAYNDMDVLHVRGILRGYDNLDPAHAFELSHVNATFRHLRAVADTGDEYLVVRTSIYNAFGVFGEQPSTLDSESNIAGLWVKPVTGAYIFEDLEMVDAGWAYVVGARDSTIRMGGSQKNRILVRGAKDAIGLGAVMLYNISNSKVDVSYLDTAGRVGGAWVLQLPSTDASGNPLPQILPQPSSYNFHHNRINNNGVDGTLSAFDLLNYGGPSLPLGNVAIRDNTINLVDLVSPSAGISSVFVDKAVVTNNKFTGRGGAAILVEPFETPGTGWLLKGNNFTGFTASMADIYLGPGTSHCTVVGGGARTSVMDLGTDNILIGVNKQISDSDAPALKTDLAPKRPTLRPGW